MPPHPPKGSGIHRYVTILLEQSENVSVGEVERQGFSLRNLMAAHNLQPVGIHYFRTQWSPAVSAFYADVLSAFLVLILVLKQRKADLILGHFAEQEEPEFGRMPRIDLYRILKEGQGSESKWAPLKSEE